MWKHKLWGRRISQNCVFLWKQENWGQQEGLLKLSFYPAAPHENHQTKFTTRPCKARTLGAFARFAYVQLLLPRRALSVCRKKDVLSWNRKEQKERKPSQIRFFESETGDCLLWCESRGSQKSKRCRFLLSAWTSVVKNFPPSASASHWLVSGCFLFVSSHSTSLRHRSKQANLSEQAEKRSTVCA